MLTEILDIKIRQLLLLLKLYKTNTQKYFGKLHKRDAMKQLDPQVKRSHFMKTITLK